MGLDVVIGEDVAEGGQWLLLLCCGREEIRLVKLWRPETRDKVMVVELRKIPATTPSVREALRESAVASPSTWLQMPKA